MAGFLLDTNMIAHYFNGHSNVINRIDTLDDEDDYLLISAITLGEIAFGHTLTTSTNHERRFEFERWLRDEFYIAHAIPVTRHTMFHYGELKAELFRRFPPESTRQNHPERCIDRVTGVELGIDENDLWIAAQAIEHNLVLVTDDEMEGIRLVTDLIDFQNWLEPI